MDVTTQGPAPSVAYAGAQLSLERQTRLVRALQRRLGDGCGGPVELIETHISFVLVCGRDAYKIKKALKTAFLDQSTLASRSRACDEELRLNRRLAADLYLGVVRVTGTIEAPQIDGAGPVLDCAVHMRAFAQQGLWDRLAANQALRASHVDELVHILVRFHDQAAAVPRPGRLGSPARVRAPMLETLDDLERVADGAADRSSLAQLRAFEASEFGRLRRAMAQRAARGRVRECHGDLHLGNITQVDGRTVVFDGIEFSDDLRWIDVISEVAFLAMDLHAHGLPALAHRFINGYLEASGDYDGLGLLRYYVVYRALVRAKVTLLRAAQTATDAQAQRAAARRYLELALRFGGPPGGAPAPALLITHGFSGSGKSTLTSSLVETLGAIRLRADVERKRHAGLSPLDRQGAHPGAALYRPAVTAAVYAALRRQAGVALEAGFPVILDATFLARAQRQAARRLAERRGIPFVILDFDVNADLLRRRVRERAAAGADPSDADESVLALQMRTAQPLSADEQASVFPCGWAASVPDGAPGVDWTPLLRRLAGPR